MLKIRIVCDDCGDITFADKFDTSYICIECGGVSFTTYEVVYEPENYAS